MYNILNSDILCNKANRGLGCKSTLQTVKAEKERVKILTTEEVKALMIRLENLEQENKELRTSMAQVAVSSHVKEGLMKRAGEEELSEMKEYVDDLMNQNQMLEDEKKVIAEENRALLSMSQFRLHSCKKQLDEKTKLYDELLQKYNHLEEASGEQKLELEQLQLAVSKEGTSVKDSEREQYLIEQLDKTRENTRKQLNKSLETIKKLKADIEYIKIESAAETSVVMSKAVSRIKFLNARIKMLEEKCSNQDVLQQKQ